MSAGAPTGDFPACGCAATGLGPNCWGNRPYQIGWPPPPVAEHPAHVVTTTFRAGHPCEVCGHLAWAPESVNSLQWHCAVCDLREKLDNQKRHCGDLDRAYSRTRQELHAIKGEAASLKGSLAEEAHAHAACLSIAEGTPGWREYAHVRAASRAVAALRNEVEALRAENTRLLKNKRELTDKLERRG